MLQMWHCLAGGETVNLLILKHLEVTWIAFCIYWEDYIWEGYKDGDNTSLKVCSVTVISKSSCKWKCIVFILLEMFLPPFWYCSQFYSWCVNGTLKCMPAVICLHQWGFLSLITVFLTLILSTFHVSSAHSVHLSMLLNVVICRFTNLFYISHQH